MRAAAQVPFHLLRDGFIDWDRADADAYSSRAEVPVLSHADMRLRQFTSGSHRGRCRDINASLDPRSPPMKLPSTRARSGACCQSTALRILSDSECSWRTDGPAHPMCRCVRLSAPLSPSRGTLNRTIFTRFWDSDADDAECSTIFSVYLSSRSVLFLLFLLFFFWGSV